MNIRFLTFAFSMLLLVASATADDKQTVVPSGDLKTKLETFAWDNLEIIVVQGKYDHVENVFDDLKIPHHLIAFKSFQNLLQGKPADTEKGAVEQIEKLDPAKQVIVINCIESNLTKSEVATLRAFVGTGGYLLTTDWALNNLVQIFPEYVGMNKDREIEDTHTVEVNPAAKKHILLQDCEDLDKSFDWWFEAESWAVIPKGKDVTTLVICSELGKLPVAVTWQFFMNNLTPPKGVKIRPGRVLHFVSHLEQQESEKTGTYNLQMVFVNFLKLKELETASK